MTSWALPAAAAAFWLGILAVRSRTAGPMAGPVLAGVGAILAVAALLGGRGRGARSRRLLEAAELEPRPDEPPGPRERILAAAGLPPLRPPVPPRAPRLAAALVGLAAMGAGWALAQSALTQRLGSLDGRYAEFRATAASDVRAFDTGWGVEADVHAVRVDERWRALDIRAWLFGNGRPRAVEAGQPLFGEGMLERLVPGRSRFEDYLIGQGVVARVSPIALSIRGPPSNPALRLANGARRALRRGAYRALPEREAGLLLGLTVGDTNGMAPEVEEDFRATGLGHLLAVSGSNVVMFLLPVLAVAGRLRLRLRARVIVAAAAVGFFVLLTRWEPSVLRASAMAVLALVGVWAGRPRSTAALLGGSVLVLLAFDPNLAGSVGFQLSVAATAGLAAMAGPVAARLWWLPRGVAVAVAATVAAQVAVTPLLLVHFGVVPTVTLVANVLAFPAVGVAFLGGVLAAGTGLIWEPLGHAAGHLAALPTRYLIEMSDAMARFPLPALTAGGVAGPAVAAGAAALAVWRLRRGRRPIVSIVVLLAGAAAAWSSTPVAGPPGTLTVTFFDVGQGDAALIRSPDGTTVLVDAGPEEDQVAGNLAALGIGRIDLAVATHAHADHIEGFPAVLARHPVALLIEPGCPAQSPSYRQFLRALRDEDVPVRHPRGGQRLTVGRLTVEVLGPDGCSPGGSEPNNDSLVLRVSWGSSRVLFPGDAEVSSQLDLLADGDPLRAQVLKVPHHGGDTSAVEFFDATDAHVGVVSTGPNEYGHPVASVLASLRAEGMRVFRTDLDGDVTVSFGSVGILVESARG